jgi:hypothetical protein
MSVGYPVEDAEMLEEDSLGAELVVDVTKVEGVYDVEELLLGGGDVNTGPVSDPAEELELGKDDWEDGA